MTFEVQTVALGLAHALRLVMKVRMRRLDDMSLGCVIDGEMPSFAAQTQRVSVVCRFRLRLPDVATGKHAISVVGSNARSVQ